MLALRNIAEFLDSTVPEREDDCSWMVSLILDGETVDTYFGGNLSSPRMGFHD